MKMGPTDHSIHLTEMLSGERGADLMLRLPPLLQQVSVQPSKTFPTKHPEFLYLHRFFSYLSVPLHMTHFSTGPQELLTALFALDLRSVPTTHDRNAMQVCEPHARELGHLAEESLNIS